MYPDNVTTGNFIYNTMLASALAQLLPAEERKVIRLWIDRLYNIKENEEIPVRNEYMWFLLLALKNRRVTSPFNELPYCGPLKPIRDILPKHVFNEVVSYDEGEANLAWIEQLMKRGKEISKAGLQESIPAPSKFLKNQPIPEKGVLCYMGAFSDQKKL